MKYNKYFILQVFHILNECSNCENRDIVILKTYFKIKT